MNNEDIETLEDLIKKCDECNLNECINCEISWTQVQSIKKFYLSYKELKENVELRENLKIATAMLTKGTYPSEKEEDNDFEKQFIPVSKIKERIKEFAKEFVETEKIEEELIFYILEGK